MQGEWAGGKGSKERTSDYKAYTSNYDKIFNKDKVEVMKEVLNYNVWGWQTVDLLEDDVIEWVKVDDGVQITIVEECYSVGEASGRGGKAFVVSAGSFEAEYKPAFK